MLLQFAALTLCSHPMRSHDVKSALFAIIRVDFVPCQFVRRTESQLDQLNMTEQQAISGEIHISPTAIASIASRAALQSYGVVGMAASNLASEVAAALSRDPNRGVVVALNGDEILIDLYVVIEYGTRIATVANSLINAVRYQVEKSVGAPVTQVNVHVQGLRVTHPDA